MWTHPKTQIYNLFCGDQQKNTYLQLISISFINTGLWTVNIYPSSSTPSKLGWVSLDSTIWEIPWTDGNPGILPTCSASKRLQFVISWGSKVVGICCFFQWKMEMILLMVLEIRLTNWCGKYPVYAQGFHTCQVVGNGISEPLTVWMQLRKRRTMDTNTPTAIVLGNSEFQTPSVFRVHVGFPGGWEE